MMFIAAPRVRRWMDRAMRSGKSRGGHPRKGAMQTMNTTQRVLPVLGAAAGVMFLAFGVALTASCRGSDQVAPEGSTITVAANPATIVLVGGSGSSDVVATVYSAVGVPQEDQDVRFSSSAGSLFTPAPDNQPAANIPIPTDNLGNAHVVLTTTTTTTVTARSGTATGTLSLSTVNGNLSAILINQDTQSAGCTQGTDIASCSDSICVTAQAVDDQGAGIAGVVIVFSLQNPSPNFSVVFNAPGNQLTTDAGGFVSTSFKLSSSDCANPCGAPDSCIGDMVAALQGGGFPSTPPLNFTASIQ